MFILSRSHRSVATKKNGRSHRTVVRRRQMLFGTVLGLGIALAACGGGSSIDLSPVATKVQVATNGFSFPNFPATAYKDEFDASDVTNMFGSGPAVCASGRGDSCVLTAEAAAFARMVNQSRASGHCEGLAAVALTRFDTSANPPTVKLPDQDETIHTIMRAFATQFIPEAQADVEKWLNKSLEEKIAALVETFKAGKLDYTLGVYVAEGGHALMPYAVEFPSKDNARIMVYDTNWPGKNRYIDVDLKAKTWRFSFSGEDPENDPDAWTGGPADMDLTAFESRGGTCPFCGDGTKSSTTTMLIRTTNLDWSVEAEGQTLKPGGQVKPNSGVVVKPIKGLNFPGAGGLFSKTQKRSAYDYLIRVPNTPPKSGQKKARTKLSFSGTTSLFAVTPTGIAQVNTPGNPNIPVEVGETSIVSKDPDVQLTLASGNLVATASGPTAVLETSASGTVEVTVTTTSGQVVKQEVTPQSPAAKVTADASGGVTALVAAASGEVVRREVSSSGVETKTVTTETLDLNATTFKAPPGLESKAIEALPSLEKRNLANPEYKADAPYVAPTTTTTVSSKNKAIEPAKALLTKFIVDPAVFGDAAFSITPPTSNSDGDFTYASSDPAVATVNATTGKVSIVGAGTTMITATQEATAGFTSGTITTPFKVGKVIAKLGTISLTKKTFGDEPFVMKEPTSTSTAPFVWESSNEAVAKVNATTGKVTIVGAGTATITASQSASANYEGATTKAVLAVAKGALTFANSTLDDVTYGVADFNLNAPTSASTGAFTYVSATPEVATVDSTTGRVRVVGAGTASLKVVQAPSANYEAATQSVNFNVKKAASRLGIFAMSSRTYGDAAFSLSPPTSPNSGSFSFTSSNSAVATVSPSGVVTIVGAGNTTITTNQAASANYESASAASTLIVARAIPTLTMTAPSDKPYGAADFTMQMPTSNSNGIVTFTSATPSVATVNATTGVVHLVGTGSAVIEASVAATNNYESRSTTVTFVALKAVPVYGVFSISSVVATTPTLQTPTPTSTSNSPFTYSSSNTSVASVNSTTGLITINSAGTASITASQVGNALFESGYASATLTVTRATPVFGQTTMAAHIFGDVPFVLTPPASTSPGAFSYSSSLTSVATVASDGTVTILGAGTTTITMTQAQTGRFNSEYTVSTLLVAKANPTYGAFSLADHESDGTSYSAPVPTSSSDGAFTYTSSNTAIATVTAGGDITVVTPGVTIITASQAATMNYNASSVSSPLTVLAPSPTLGAFTASSYSESPGFAGVRYVNYFNDNPDWFATATKQGETNTLTDFTGFYPSSQDYYSWEWKGVFKSAAAGTYHFCTVSDDASFIWFGNNALSGATTSNATVQNPGQHGMTERCGDITMAASTSYAFRMVFGDGCCGDGLQMYFTINGGNRIYNGTGYYYSQQPSRVGDPNYTVAHPTSNSAGAFTYTSSNPSVATINAVTGEVAVLTAGSSTFTATQAAAGTYRSASTSTTVTFEKGIQTGLTATPATCALGGPCALGDTGPGGGTVIYAPGAVFASGAVCATNCEYIEVAPVNWNGATSDLNNQSTWDCAGTSLNTTDFSIGGGFANTTAMAASCQQGAPAGSLVRNSTFGNQNDWYIPSKLEVREIYNQRAVVPGYQATGNYWSSTEVSGTNSYQQSGTTLTSIVKTAMGIIRPVRSFTAQKFALPFNSMSVAIVPSGGFGTGSISVSLFDAGSASCVLANNTITASMSGTCKIKVTRTGDANWNEGTSAEIVASFYGPAMSTVNVGVYTTCGVNVQGGVSCWGNGDWGILGDNRRTTSYEPVTVMGLTSGVTSLAAGQHHNCALMSTGDVKCWGYGESGQLGTGGGGQYNSPVDASALNFKAVKIVAGHQHTCALTTSGGVKCWGWNGYGQLGDGTSDTRFTPVDAIGLTSGVIDISANYATTCAVLENHNVKCWGRNDHGQIGDGTNSNRFTPVLVTGVSGMAKSVASGVYSTCVITNSNTLMCWGHNGWGDLGIGSNASSNVPVAVPSLSNVSKVTIGEGYMCAISNGGLKCWGRNDQGQLGDGTNTQRTVPTAVPGLSSGVSDVSAGIFQHTCAIVNGGTVKCWGWNDYGQLGDGTNTTRNTVRDVLRMRGSRQIATTLGALTMPTGVMDVNHAPFTVAPASASRTGTLTYESSDPSVATVNASTGQVTIVGAGHSVISATMAGDGVYSVGSSRLQLYVRPLNPQNLSDCQLALSCSVGDIGPGGGRVFYVDTNDTMVGVDYLEAAPADVAMSPWCGSSNWGTYTYGPQNTTIGMYNMQTFLATCTSGAAHTAAAYTNNGYSDWYLPTPTEMQNVAAAFAASGGSNTVNNGIVNLASNTKYWTSYEQASGYAHIFDTSNNTASMELKTNVWNVRPVRAFVSRYTPIIHTQLVGYSLNTGSTDYSHEPFDVTRPTSMSGAYMTFASDAPNVANVGQYSGRVTNYAVGSANFTATQPAWAGFSASAMQVGYSVTPSTPTITGFNAPNTALKTSTPPFAAGWPSSPNPTSFTFASSNTAVATVNAATGVVTITGAGQAVITATQSASTPWTSGSVTMLLNIAKSCADGGACAVGDTGPGGGVIFYAASAKQAWGRYLEAAPADLSASYTWCNTSQDTLGARETLVGFGQANTNAMIASCTSGAAIAADSYTVNGKSDWYLPGFDELEELYRARAYAGMSTGTYWSSTEDNSGAAKRFDFDAGVYISGTKAAPNRVRPIRSVEGPADGLTALNAGVSATQLMMDNGYTGTGNYFIKPTGYSGQAVQLWCDFTHLGGGWVLIGKGRQSNDDAGGWFGTENALDTTGLMQANSKNAGISKVSSEFVNYLMNGTTNGWTNLNTNNYLVVNRISDAVDGLGGVGDSWSIKITNETQFKWVNQFGSTVRDQAPQTGSGLWRRYTSDWLSGTLTYDLDRRIDDYGDNDGRRLFTWHWGGHDVYHGWSAGSSAGVGFTVGGEGHPIQFVQLWAR